jgi:hypothetical protein
MVDHQFESGNVTVAKLYSGLPGAYCQNQPGWPCSQGAAAVSGVFSRLGGGNPNNPYDLLWPCKD